MHLGWSGGLPCSLSEAGSQFQITRERARQVYAAALPLLRESSDQPALKAVLAYVRQRNGEPAARIEADLSRRGLTRGNLHLEGIHTAARVFGYDPRFTIDEIGGVRFVGKISKIGKAILNTAIKLTVRSGVVRVSDLRAHIFKSQHATVLEGLIREILQTRPDLIWLDNNREWFCLSAVRRNHLILRISKVFAVAQQTHISTLYLAVSRDYRPFNVPKAVLWSLCRTLHWCRVNGQRVAADPAPRASEVLARSEEIVHEILKGRGGVLGIDALRSLCHAKGLKKDNLWRVLMFSPIVRRFAPQVYCLIALTTVKRVGIG